MALICKVVTRVLQKGPSIHTTSACGMWANTDGGPRKWLEYNNKMYPPQGPEEEPRPAFVCHVKTNIKYSPWKMWYIACLVRGMTADEAVKQLDYVGKKGAAFAKETILEAQELAVKEHNVEFKTNLWVAESFVGKGPVFKGMRRHAKGRIGKVEYFHCHYFVRLEEGKPPLHYYYHKRPLTGEEMLDNYIQRLRKRKIIGSL